MRLLVALSIVVALWNAQPHEALGQGSARHHVRAIGGGDWDAWRGRDVAFLRAQLGEPDRVTGPRWHYAYVTVGSYDGPYQTWELTFVVESGRIASVRAVRGEGVGCDIYE